MRGRGATATILMVLLLSTTLAGCLGGEDAASPDAEPDTDVDTTRNSGCSTTAVDGRVTPNGGLSVSGEAGADGASAQMSMDTGGAGVSGINVTLARDGEVVWSDDAGQGVTATDWANSAQQLAAGNYTLTASTDDGVYDVQELWLEITWGGGSCS